VAATIVEKVRVNPGNYADKKKFEEIDYTDASYALELERIKARFLPLVNSASSTAPPCASAPTMARSPTAS
jgi:4-hydroxy-3-methylbut-2-en-1-yl diphosphate synthase IspG/GcpE